MSKLFDKMKPMNINKSQQADELGLALVGKRSPNHDKKTRSGNVRAHRLAFLGCLALMALILVGLSSISQPASALVVTGDQTQQPVVASSVDYNNLGELQRQLVGGLHFLC